MKAGNAAKRTGKNNVSHSIGFRMGVIIAILLCLILGVKTASDVIYNYSTTTARDEKNKLEETRRLAKELEVRFAAAYQSGSDLQAVIQSIMDNETPYGRSRETVIGNMKQVYKSNNYLYGIGAYFEPDAFDGKDSFMDPGRLTAYVYGF